MTEAHCMICGRSKDPIRYDDERVVCGVCAEMIIHNHARLYVPSLNAYLKDMKSKTRDTYEYVAAHPGQTAEEVSEALGSDLRVIRVLLPRLRERGMLFAIAVKGNLNKWYCTDISTY